MSFPTHFLDSNKKLWRILRREMYVMSSELDNVAPAATDQQFPASDLIHNVSAPFEIHTLIPRAWQIAGAAGTAPVADPAPDMNAFWRLQINAIQLGDMRCFKSKTRVDLLVDRTLRQWHLSGCDDSQPVYLERAQGYAAFMDSLIPAGGLNIRGGLDFRGYLLQLQEATQAEVDAYKAGNLNRCGYAYQKNA